MCFNTIIKKEVALNQKRELKIEIGEKEAEGIYSNFVMIAHSSSEFIIDFARLLPGLPKAKVMARIIMTPQHVMLLKRALEDNIKKYESSFGKIPVPEIKEGKMGFVSK